MKSLSQDVFANARDKVDANWKGVFAAFLIAISARFLSGHFGAPDMLMALLLGLVFHFLFEEESCKAGIDWTARVVLRIGVALLGVRISAEMLQGLEPKIIALILIASVSTIGFGLVVSRMLGKHWRFGILTGGSVAICGASAAMAIASVLPKNEESEKDLLFTILSVTMLSTLAMILYPIISNYMSFDEQVAGVFIGASIHDVAQVVGAGFSESEQTGEVAVVVKLIRVAMLAPVVMIIAVLCNRSAPSRQSVKRPPILPVFIVAFLIIAVANSFGIIPRLVTSVASDSARWALLVAVAAVGMKTSLKEIASVGPRSVSLVILETLFLGALVLSALLVL